MTGLVAAPRRVPPADPVTLLDDLEAGQLRAAEPDPSAPGGWRVRPEVKLAILERIRDRTAATWRPAR